jgi:hypothetical protein
MQCLLMVRNSAHNRGDVGSTPTAATFVWGWCNGNTSVSKTEVLGSSPSSHAMSSLMDGAVDKLVKSQDFQS